MASERRIDFWFSVASTYTYFAVMRVPEIEHSTQVPFRWRPFDVGRILREMDNRFLRGKPEKYAYMWRDISRRAEMYGLPAKVPVPHPIKASDTGNRVALLGLEEGWGIAYLQATYRLWFTEGLEPGSELNLSTSLRECGQDPEHVVARAEAEEFGRALQENTDQARSLGVFGAPTFAVDQDLFWGSDRLDDAVMWFKHGRLLAPERRI
ncbi:2-hydroxychromene-2-carboxylate isomerase [Muricoccus vinaceus]|uniref:2-hydroxychromene-2-carboxylate isomerase n=1 Tax=Muricoccus vinaceus TaxID=424704 RepID=A0ABV6ITF2_9PROT